MAVLQTLCCKAYHCQDTINTHNSLYAFDIFHKCPSEIEIDESLNVSKLLASAAGPIAEEQQSASARLAQSAVNSGIPQSLAPIRTRRKEGFFRTLFRRRSAGGEPVAQNGESRAAAQTQTHRLLPDFYPAEVEAEATESTAPNPLLATAIAGLRPVGRPDSAEQEAQSACPAPQEEVDLHHASFSCFAPP